MPKIMAESEVEEACLEMLEELGYKILHGPGISEGGTNEKRKYNEVALTQRLKDALERINKNIPKEAIDEDGEEISECYLGKDFKRARRHAKIKFKLISFCIRHFNDYKPEL